MGLDVSVRCKLLNVAVKYNVFLLLKIRLCHTQ